MVVLLMHYKKSDLRQRYEVRVCMYVYVCVCTCMYVYVCVCTCMYVYVWGSVGGKTYKHMFFAVFWLMYQFTRVYRIASCVAWACDGAIGGETCTSGCALIHLVHVQDMQECCVLRCGPD